MRIVQSLLLTISVLLGVNLFTSGAHSDGWYFPSGGIIAVTAGTCPPGFTEQNFAGRHLLATVAANGDVGTTGGSSSYTPAGTNATGTVTPTGTIAWPAGVPTHSGTAASFSGNAVVAASTNSGTKLVTSNTSTGVSPVTTATGTVTITSQGTIAWPIGVPAFSGSSSTTSAEVFSGTPATITPSYVKVIMCRKD